MNTKMKKNVFGLCVMTFLVISCVLVQKILEPTSLTQTLTPMSIATVTPMVTMGPTLTPTLLPTETPIPASGEWFVFASTKDDDDGDDTSETDIYIARLDGSEIYRLTDADGNDYAPKLSPDERKVLFVSGSKGDIYTINADGTDLTRLTDDPATDKDPSWSPDGSKIVFVSDRDGDDQIYIMNADGSAINRLTDDEADYHDPAWSPDGTKIAYAVFQKGVGYDIYVMDADGGNQLVVISDSNFNVSPTWSSDGNFLAYTSWSTENIDKNQSLTILTLTNSEEILILSPDKIEELISSIRVIKLDGSGMKQLTEKGVSSWSPSWSPDGGKIIFTAKSDSKSKIFIMSADGTGKTPLTSGEGSDYSPDFADSHLTHIVSLPPISSPATSTTTEAYPGSTSPRLDILGCNPVSECPDSAVSIRSFFGENEILQYNTEYPVSVSLDTEVRFYIGWCTLEQEMLDDNLQHIEFVFSVDGTSFIDQFKTNTYTVQDDTDSTKLNYCHSVGGVISGWQKDQDYQIVFGMIFTDTIFDGWDTYEPGDYTRIYLISVKP